MSRVVIWLVVAGPGVQGGSSLSRKGVFWLILSVGVFYFFWCMAVLSPNEAAAGGSWFGIVRGCNMLLWAVSSKDNLVSLFYSSKLYQFDALLTDYTLQLGGTPTTPYKNWNRGFIYFWGIMAPPKSKQINIVVCNISEYSYISRWLIRDQCLIYV